MYAPRRPACITTLPEHSEILRELRNTTAENTGRRSISARSVRRNTQFNRIGRPIARFVGLESTGVTVAHFSQGTVF